MLNIEEFRPHFLAFCRALEGEVEKGERDVHCEQFALFLERLHQRVRWEAPLIATLEEGKAFGHEYEIKFQRLREQLERGVPNVDAARELHRSLEELHLSQQRLPVFTDAKVLNEIMVLLSGGLADLTGSATEAVGARLPLALEWIGSQAGEWRHFFELFPERSPLSERVSVTLSALKGACGGLFSAVEAGDVLEEARPAGSLILRALKELAELHSLRHDLERDRFGQGDLMLARVLESLRLGGELSPSAESELSGFVLERSRMLEGLGLKLTWDGPVDSSLIEATSRQARQLSDFFQRWKRGEMELPEAAAFLEGWEQEFQDLWTREGELVIDGSRFEEVTLE